MRTIACWSVWGGRVLLPSHKLGYFTCVDRCLSFRIFISSQWISTCWVLWGCFPFSFLNPISPSLQVPRSMSRGRKHTGCIQGVGLKGGRAWGVPVSKGTCRQHGLHFITLTGNKGITLELLTTSLWPEITGPSSLKAHWHRTLNKVKAQWTPNSHLPQYLQLLSNPSSSPASNTLTWFVPAYLLSLLASLSHFWSLGPSLLSMIFLFWEALEFCQYLRV